MYSVYSFKKTKTIMPSSKENLKGKGVLILSELGIMSLKLEKRTFISRVVKLHA